MRSEKQDWKILGVAYDEVLELDYALYEIFDDGNYWSELLHEHLTQELHSSPLKSNGTTYSMCCRGTVGKMTAMYLKDSLNAGNNKFHGKQRQP